MMNSSPSLRIALLTYATKPRGSVIHTLELAKALHALGHQVCVYALDKDGSGFDVPLPFAVQLVSTQAAPDGIDALIQQRIQEFVDYFSSTSQVHDCYHAQDCISANALTILREQQQIPHFVRTVHHIEDYNSVYLQQCQDRSIRSPDLCLCVSRYWQDQLQQRYQIHAPQVINGVDTQRFTPAADGSETQLKRQFGLTGTPIYLTVGGIEPRKNSLVLLQAFAQLRHHYPNAQLVIAGGATLFDYQSYRDQFFQLADQLNLEVGQALILPGVVSDGLLPALYRSADAFVFPSVQEGWGLVVLEAIASGLPVIASNQPPFTEFLSSQSALLIDPNSAAAIAAAMRLIVQPEVSHQLTQSRQAISDQYSWQASAKMHLVQYYRLLQGSQSLETLPV